MTARSKNDRETVTLLGDVGVHWTAQDCLHNIADSFLEAYASPTSKFRGIAFEDWGYPMFFGRQRANCRMRTAKR
eukprot:scaffold4247_cov66-Cylindrotheca_fusiformis.AAC.3